MNKTINAQIKSYIKSTKILVSLYISKINTWERLENLKNLMKLMNNSIKKVQKL